MNTFTLLADGASVAMDDGAVVGVVATASDGADRQVVVLRTLSFTRIAEHELIFAVELVVERLVVQLMCAQVH